MTFSPEAFNALLVWLDTNREAAGQKYETIRAGLIRIFVSQGFSDAEDLADLTIDRVIARLPEIVSNYVGEQARYFGGVARNVAHEARRRKELATDLIPEKQSQATETSDTHDCLIVCLRSLSRQNQELILDYYLYQGHDKAEHHRHMAREFGITDGALRTRTHHIRVSLEKCVLHCLSRLTKKQKPAWGALLKRRHITNAIGKEHQS